MNPKRISVLGSTGSIGVTTLDIAARFPEQFQVVGLGAGKNVARLAEQVKRFRPAVAAVGDRSSIAELRALVPDFGGEILAGADGLEAVATAPTAELVVAGLVGALGLLPTLAALKAGKNVALANKEALVVAGQLMTDAAHAAGARLLPIDSEHNALFQSLEGHRREDVRRLILTASGGPFLRTPASDLTKVTRSDALKHPTWKMGEKITIDSATLMNKGLEVIEAHWLFGLPADQIDVLIHPQSIVHSMVEYVDGSVISQMGIPDMSIPISYILAYPGRLPLGYLPRLDLVGAPSLEFLAPDFQRFPCLGLAYAALRAGGTAPAILNAANEVTVAAFLAGRISFTEIADINSRVVDALPHEDVESLEQLLDVDQRARESAEAAIGAGAASYRQRGGR